MTATPRSSSQEAKMRTTSSGSTSRRSDARSRQRHSPLKNMVQQEVSAAPSPAWPARAAPIYRGPFFYYR
eukprot:4577762-Pyramimonas_sp.AAC.1